MLHVVMPMMLWTGPTPGSQVTSCISYTHLPKMETEIVSFPKQEVMQSLFTGVWVQATSIWDRICTPSCF